VLQPYLRLPVEWWGMRLRLYDVSSGVRGG
jgi:hypothetical protein